MSDRVETLFRAHHADVAAYCRRRLAGDDDAEDAAIEVFAVAIRRLDEIPDGDEARLWLFGVARGVVANQRRAGRRRERLVGRLRAEPQADAVDGPALALISDPRVQDAFASLSPGDRELLALVAWEGLEPREIAVVLDRPAAIVSTRLARARRRFARVYDSASSPCTLVRQP